MNLVIFGASGGIGRILTDLARERGHRVRAVYRGAPPPAGASFEPSVVPDVTDARALGPALEGADAVLSALGLRHASGRNPFSRLVPPLDLTASFARALVAATQASGARPRVIVVSSAGVDESWTTTAPMLRLLFRLSPIHLAFDDLCNQERALRESALPWLAVRPVTLTDAPASGRVRETARFGSFSRIPREDVARYMLGVAEGTASPSGPTPMIEAG